MQPTSKPEPDCAVEAATTLRHAVPWRLTSARAVADGLLRVRFVDGTEGVVDMRGFLVSPRIDGTVFEALRDPAIFAEVHVVLGAVQWPKGADLAPDAMYDAIRERGAWVVS